MKKNVLLLNLLFIIIAFIFSSCSDNLSNEPQEISSEIIIDNIGSPIKAAYCLSPVARREPISHILLIITENDMALLLNLSHINSGSKLATGTYKCIEEDRNKDYTFIGWTGTANFSASTDKFHPGIFDTDDYTEIIQGEVNISTQKDNYILSFEGINEKGSSIKLFYKGIFLDNISQD